MTFLETERKQYAVLRGLEIIGEGYKELEPRIKEGKPGDKLEGYLWNA